MGHGKEASSRYNPLSCDPRIVLRKAAFVTKSPVPSTESASVFDLELPRPPISLAQLAAFLPEATLHGDGFLLVEDVVHPHYIQSAIEDGANPDRLMPLILSASALALVEVQHCKVALVLESVEVAEGRIPGYIKIVRPKQTLVNLLAIFDKPSIKPTGVHETAVIDPTARVHPTAKIGAYVVVGPHCEIGENTVLMSQVTVGARTHIGSDCLIYPGARVGDRVRIGDYVIIQFNACIGSDGFSFATPNEGSVDEVKGGKSRRVRSKNDALYRINSVGIVIIEDHVEVGACTCIDRATVGATIVKRHTKIDNLVQIAHNSTLGENCLVASQVGIAGSCKIGNRVVLAGQAGLADHITINDDAIVLAKSGLMRDVEPGQIVGGIPARSAKDYMQQHALTMKLPVIRKEVLELKKRLAELEKQCSWQQASPTSMTDTDDTC